MKRVNHNSYIISENPEEQLYTMGLGADIAFTFHDPQHQVFGLARNLDSSKLKDLFNQLSQNSRDIKLNVFGGNITGNSLNYGINLMEYFKELNSENFRLEVEQVKINGEIHPDYLAIQIH